MSFTSIVVLFFCNLFIVASTAKIGTKPEQTSGSYLVLLNRIVRCENPAVPFMKDPTAFLDVRVRNNILKGNITFIGGCSHIQATLHDSFNIDGKWQTTFIARNVSCHTKVIAMMTDLIGVRYNKKNCGAVRGSYQFEVDYNKIYHVSWMPSEYGKMVRRLEVTCRAGTFACYNFEAEVKPTNQ